ncbi:MAG: OmpA family protein [Firmicutes bacterium]|nr:OmpA family protein [Bacillota bacterium]
MKRRYRQRRLDDAVYESKQHGNWIYSYADMISLLTALFIVLYGMSKVNEGKFRQLAGSLSKSFSATAARASDKEIEMAAQLYNKQLNENDREKSYHALLKAIDDSMKDKKRAELEALKNHFQYNLDKGGLSKNVQLRVEDRGVVIGLMTDGMSFEIGKADVTDSCRKVLDNIAPTLRATKQPIRIEGNTCNIPIHSTQYASNWELSAARATSVGKFLILNENIDPERISIIGYGEFRPLVPNTTDQNRAKNRRVDIVIMNLEGKDTKFSIDGSGSSTPPVPPPPEDGHK